MADTTVKGKGILLDTNVIEYLLSDHKDLANKVAEKLSELRKNQNKLYISEITSFEILRGISDKNKEEATETLNSFIKVPMNEARITKAAILYGKYKKDTYITKSIKSISDCDILIGSLIFTEYKPLLLTGDYWDFPRPFFVEKGIEKIEYTKHKRPMGGVQKHCVYLYYFEANIPRLSET